MKTTEWQALIDRETETSREARTNDFLNSVHGKHGEWDSLFCILLDINSSRPEISALIDGLFDRHQVAARIDDMKREMLREER